MNCKNDGCGRQVADTLAEIHERHEAVKELEKSLLDLHQIFLDMAVLVEAQGEMLDNIGAQARRRLCRSATFARHLDVLEALGLSARCTESTTACAVLTF